MVGLKEKLLDILDGDVLDDEKTLYEYSHDASIFKVKPEVVVFPRTTEDIKKLVVFIKDNRSRDPNLSLTARSGGTDISGGPLNESIIVDFTKYFNNSSVDIENLTAVAEPGVYYENLKKEILNEDISLSSRGSSKKDTAIGGIIMNNSGGEKDIQRGQIQNFVKELNVVCSDGNEYSFKKLNRDELEEKKNQNNFEGELYRRTYNLIEENFNLIEEARPRVAKNSSGYALWDVWDREYFDLTQLFTGSQGTLGILTKSKMGFIKEKKHKRLMVLFFDKHKELPEVMNAILQTSPESVESFDNEILKLMIRFIPDIAKKTCTNLFLFVLKFFPEMWMCIKMRRVPKLIVLVQLVEDSEDKILEKIANVEKAIKPFSASYRIIKNRKEANKYWTIRKESFALLRNHLSGKRTVAFVDDFCICPEVAEEFLPKILAILKDYDIKANVFGYSGDGNFHIIPLMDLTDRAERETLPLVLDKAYDLIIKYKGTITAEHNDGIIRTPYLTKMYGPRMYSLFREIKEIFDPYAIFNPGKKVDGSVEYMKAHINFD